MRQQSIIVVYKKNLYEWIETKENEITEEERSKKIWPEKNSTKNF